MADTKPNLGRTGPLSLTMDRLTEEFWERYRHLHDAIDAASYQGVEAVERLAALLADASCLPAGYLAEVAAILRAGAEHHGCRPHETGGGQVFSDHLHHAIAHLLLCEQGDTSEPHLLHAAARLALAWEREQAAGAGEP